MHGWGARKGKRSEGHANLRGKEDCFTDMKRQFQLLLVCLVDRLLLACLVDRLLLACLVGRYGHMIIVIMSIDHSRSIRKKIRDYYKSERGFCSQLRVKIANEPGHLERK